MDNIHIKKSMSKDTITSFDGTKTYISFCFFAWNQIMSELKSLFTGLSWVGWGEKNYSRWTSCPISQTLHSSMTIFESICRMWLLLQRFYRLLRILKWFRVELRELKLQPFPKQTIHRSLKKLLIRVWLSNINKSIYKIQSLCIIEMFADTFLKSTIWHNLIFYLCHYTKVRCASFLSGGFTTIAVINPPERKLAKRNSVHWPKQ